MQGGSVCLSGEVEQVMHSPSWAHGLTVAHLGQLTGVKTSWLRSQTEATVGVRQVGGAVSCPNMTIPEGHRTSAASHWPHLCPSNSRHAGAGLTDNVPKWAVLAGAGGEGPRIARARTLGVFNP